VKQRIQKLLAGAGVASRRAIEQMVVEGRVAVNGQVVRELPVLVDPDTDAIRVDGQQVRLGGASTARRLYFLLNKPKGVYCTNVAQGEQLRAIDLLPPHLPRLYPVGRLESESRGLLLLTNDGELTHKLTHPRYGVAKTYRAIIDGHIDDRTLAELERGVFLADRETGSAARAAASHLRIVDRGRHRSTIEITIREERNRQVRRMLAKVGHKVRDLSRVRMGPLTLEGLAPGQFRPLMPGEINGLRRLVAGARSDPPPHP
jgi:23S rRNA pseudouridine2605 synthase